MSKPSYAGHWAVLVAFNPSYPRHGVLCFEILKITPQRIYTKGCIATHYRRKEFVIETFADEGQAKARAASLRHSLGIDRREDLQRQWSAASDTARDLIQTFSRSARDAGLADTLPKEWKHE